MGSITKCPCSSIGRHRPLFSAGVDEAAEGLQVFFGYFYESEADAVALSALFFVGPYRSCLYLDTALGFGNAELEVAQAPLLYIAVREYTKAAFA